MAPAEILDAMLADGLSVELDGADIALDGPYDAVARWLPLVRDHKAELRATLAGFADSAMPPPHPSAENPARRDPGLRATGMAGPDDRRTCSQCLNVKGDACSIARPGGLVSASKGYRPANLPMRCAGYSPSLRDKDQRAGADRWPGLKS